MAPLTIILGIIMVWCFYFRFMKAVMARKRLIWVEVLDQKNSDIFISRFLAKQNLHLVGEVTQKLRSYNYLFDKYWYRQREFQYIDAISNVEQQQFSNNLTETNIKDLDQEKQMPEDMDAMRKIQDSTPEKIKEENVLETKIKSAKREYEKSKFAEEVEKKQTHPANESKDSMNFGGLIALQKQQKKETQENRQSTVVTPGLPKNEITKNGDTSAKKTEGSGELDGKKDKKSKVSKKGTKPVTEENGIGVAGYMKDISKINQDIENIKSRSGKNAVVTKGSIKPGNELPKEKISTDESKNDKTKNGTDNLKNTNDSYLKAKELLTKEQMERQRQMSIISF